MTIDDVRRFLMQVARRGEYDPRAIEVGAVMAHLAGVRASLLADVALAQGTKVLSKTILTQLRGG